MLGPQVIRLRPSPHGRTPILSYELKVSPATAVKHWHFDPSGNSVARVLFPDKTDEFIVEVDLTADLIPINPFDFFIEPYASSFPFEYAPEIVKDLSACMGVEAPGPLFQYFVQSVPRQNQGTLGFLVDLNRRVRDDISYVRRMDEGVQTCEETLQNRSGSCRDSGWFLVQLLRQLGFAARFVSGYLIQLDPDSVDLHAWAEVFLPGAGWIGLDATSGLLAAECHIPLACAAEPANAAPITGTVGPSRVEFDHVATVRRVVASPLSLEPPAEDRWARLEQVAQQVDADLIEGDVRLTMGGEPTFVGIEEQDSAQWNTEALGPLKRERAMELIRRLQDRLAPGALLHFGQGKWYPGEPIPRWALQCFWRSDGVPVWEDARLIAQAGHDYGFTLKDALEFLKALTRRLQVSSKNILAAYEDTFYYLWRERRLPVNVTPEDSKLLNASEREELARVFDKGLGEPVGYVLPIRRRQHDGELYWSSQLWFLRPERMLLLQGDSPLGYRLRLDSLPWVAPDDIDFDYETDPFEPGAKLPDAPVRRMDLFQSEAAEDPLPAAPKVGESAKDAIRPALSVEAREGRLHVFLPYTTRLPDYLDLIAAIEDTCRHLGKPVWIEGYAPPSDSRLKSFSVTPDPGVVEVNLPPAANWSELRRIHEIVFDEAQRCRLTAEKFQHDGRHTATGGGSHIVIGGPTAADSPLLRRPDLLRSMLAFWQNHPCLSYLFSGRFIGPTSQHPRIDEARMDALYELEIAFSQTPKNECPPWLVDRLYRNLLVDITGNTHRAEFCIDKLYPPEGSGSRLGLLELRAFEMPPYLGMSLAELILVRALVSVFWKRPYEARLVRWGTALHDRFLLPHYVRQDLRDVVEMLQKSGYAFESAWFDLHWDFRFPKIGSIDVDGVRLELRHALEPWHVLGEEGSSGGTVRRVDSSLDRIQVKVSGFTADTRYAVSCNGRRVPLNATGVPGEMVAGVRFRAWQPSSCLHPTIPIQSPLVFEIFDLWKHQSIGGCAFHVAHPEGRWHTARPADAIEAEGRRREHFRELSPSRMAVAPSAEDPNPNTPMTLDLRWPTVAP